jgi:hypothetical protein
MSERERWVVYPLLFLALGAALRDKLVDRTTAKSIVCQELIVVDEQPLGREPILLARIGRPDPSDAEQISGGQLLLNGQLMLVDRAPIASNQVMKTLVTIGGVPHKKGTIGDVRINGQLVVDGPINAMLYAYRGMPILPALRAMLPGLPEMLQAIPQGDTPQQENAPPNSTPPAQPTEPTAPTADEADDAAAAATPPSDESPRDPLADPQGVR